MSIPQQIIDQLIDTADIVSIIGRHVELKRAGASFKGCCPFHQEKTPSFHVRPNEGYYHCFGCKESGNAISFLMNYEGQSFLEAVDTLSEQTGIDVPKSAPNPALKYKKNKPSNNQTAKKTQSNTVKKTEQVVQQHNPSSATHSRNVSNNNHQPNNTIIKKPTNKETSQTQQTAEQNIAETNIAALTRLTTQDTGQSTNVSLDDINSALAYASDTEQFDGFAPDFANSFDATEPSAYADDNDFIPFFDGEGVSTPSTSDNKEGDLYELLDRVNQYYQQQRKISPKALMYLNQRGLTEDSMDTFGLGFAPSGWQHLLEQFPEDVAGLKTLGLVRISDKSKREFCLLRDRVIFPIKDHKGRVVGFGGRSLEKDAQPKYINSPESVVFKKQHILYGLYEGRKARAENWMMVEGYMDVIALHQAGIYGAVASMGTATNQEQIKKLFKQSPKLTLAFDGDSAGRKAAWRTLEVGLPTLEDEYELRFLLLPDGDDPDSLIKKEGVGAMQKRINDAPPLSEFLITELSARYDMSTPEGKGHLMSALKALLKNLPQYSSYRRLLNNEVKDKLGLGYTPFQSKSQRLAQQNRVSKYRDTLLDFDKKYGRARTLAYLLLLQPSMISHCAVLAELLQNIGHDDLLPRLITRIQKTAPVFSTQGDTAFRHFLLASLSDSHVKTSASITATDNQQTDEPAQVKSAEKSLADELNDFIKLMSLTAEVPNDNDDNAMLWIEPVFHELNLMYQAELIQQKIKQVSLEDMKMWNARLTEIRKQLQFRETGLGD